MLVGAFNVKGPLMSKPLAERTQGLQETETNKATHLPQSACLHFESFKGDGWVL